MADYDELDWRPGLPDFLMEPQGVFQRRWPWMLVVFILTAIAGGAFVSTLPQTFEASARLLLTRQRVPEEFVRSTSMERVPELVNAVVGEILSRDSLVAVAEATHLAEEVDGDEASADLIARMREAITVEQDLDMQSQRYFGAGEDTFILAIRFEWEDPELAAEVANELSSRLISAHLRRQSQQARLTADFLRREAERAEAELAEQRTRITEFTEAHRGQLPSELDTKLARLERLQQRSQSLALQISDAEGRLLILQSQEPVQEDALEGLRTRLAQELTVYTDGAPHVIALRQEIEAREAKLAGQRIGSGARPVSSDPSVAAVQREVDTLRAQARSIEQEIGALDTAVALIPAHREELVALEQQEELLREHFVDASRKVQEAELAESLQQAQQGFQVASLDAAVAPPAPKRRRWKFALVAAVGVLGASALAGLLLEFMDPVVVSSRQLERQTGALPLGVIPRIR